MRIKQIPIRIGKVRKGEKKEKIGADKKGKRKGIKKRIKRKKREKKGEKKGAYG